MTIGVLGLMIQPLTADAVQTITKERYVYYTQNCYFWGDTHEALMTFTGERFTDNPLTFTTFTTTFDETLDSCGASVEPRFSSADILLTQNGEHCNIHMIHNYINDFACENINMFAQETILIYGTLHYTINYNTDRPDNDVIITLKFNQAISRNMP